MHVCVLARRSYAHARLQPELSDRGGGKLQQGNWGEKSMKRLMSTFCAALLYLNLALKSIAGCNVNPNKTPPV